MIAAKSRSHQREDKVKRVALAADHAGFSLKTKIAAYLEDITGRSVRIKQMSWNLLKVVGLVWPMVGALGKMRYLWNTPHMLDSRTFDALLPEFRSTPPQLALRSAIQHLELPYLASAPLAEPAQ